MTKSLWFLAGLWLGVPIGVLIAAFFCGLKSDNNKGHIPSHPIPEPHPPDMPGAGVIIVIDQPDEPVIPQPKNVR